MSLYSSRSSHAYLVPSAYIYAFASMPKIPSRKFSGISSTNIISAEDGRFDEGELLLKGAISGYRNTPGDLGKLYL